MTTIAHTVRDVVTVAGPDALTYLQGQLSQDLSAMAVGESSRSFVLAPQGKVDGWGRLYRVAPDQFEIDTDAGAGAHWEARLRRFLLRTKAEISLEQSVGCVAVRGEELPAGPGVRRPLGPGIIGSDLIRPPSDSIDPEGRPAGVSPDATVVDPSTLESERIHAGVPRWGAELTEDTIPATVGQWVIDASVSFTKGCYTGQELVARIDSRGGKVPRQLVGLAISGPPPAVDSEVLVDGASVGTVTSSAARSNGVGSVGLVFVPRALELTDAGVTASVAGADAVISPLPLSPS